MGNLYFSFDMCCVTVWDFESKDCHGKVCILILKRTPFAVMFTNGSLSQKYCSTIVFEDVAVDDNMLWLNPSLMLECFPGWSSFIFIVPLNAFTTYCTPRLATCKELKVLECTESGIEGLMSTEGLCIESPEVEHANETKKKFTYANSELFHTSIFVWFIMFCIIWIYL